MIYEGTVIDNRDPWKCGRIRVFCPGLLDIGEGDWVNGSSPVVGHGAGFFAVPEIMSTVLLTNAEDHRGAVRPYWIAGVWETEGSTVDHIGDEILKGTNVPDAMKTYQYNLVPNRHTWKTQLGHTITLSEFVFSDRDQRLIQDNYLDIRSAGGKYLKFDDGVNNEDPGGAFDNIELADELENKVRIQTGKSPEYTQGSIYVQSETGVVIESDSGNTFIEILEGDGEIRIQHYGKGSINIEAGPGENHDIACDHDLSVEILTGSSAGTITVTGDITCPVTKHPKVNINGQTAITLR